MLAELEDDPAGVCSEAHNCILEARRTIAE